MRDDTEFSRLVDAWRTRDARYATSHHPPSGAAIIEAIRNLRMEEAQRLANERDREDALALVASWAPTFLERGLTRRPARAQSTHSPHRRG